MNGLGERLAWEDWGVTYVIYIRGDWPSGLRSRNQTWKVSGSNTSGRSERLKDPTSLRGSQ